jgi:hypothetical protein
MSVTHRIQLRFQRGNDVIDKTVVSASGSENNLDEPIADSVSDDLVAWACDLTQLKSFYMVADKALTIKTNSSGTPDDTFVLTANEPMVWTENCGLANPFSQDVTALYVSNSSGSATVLKIRKLEDPTV